MTATVLGVEHMVIEDRSPTQPNVATYGFDLSTEHIGNERISVAAFRVSDCEGGLNPQPPSWFLTEEAPEGASAYWCPTPDSDQRPEGYPLHASTLLPYLEPRYGDVWVAFIVEMPEPED